MNMTLFLCVLGISWPSH